MKRFYFAAFAALALVTGCQKNEVIVENPTLKAPIEFATYSGKAAMTKGEEMDLAKLKADHFGVTAWYTGTSTWAAPSVAPNFMYNQEILPNGENWQYTPVKYWPTMVEDKISFFAYAPYATLGKEHGIVLEDKDKAATSLTFTVNNDVAKQIDFVAAVAMNQQHNVVAPNIDANGRGTVTFNFKHELTRLGFTVKLDESMTDGTNATHNYTANGSSVVVIKKVQLDGPNMYFASATYNWPTDPAKNGTWTGRKWANTAFNFENSFNANLLAGNKIWDDVNLTYNKPALVIRDHNSVSLLSTKGTEAEYFFLIPVEGGLKENASTVTIEYDIVTKDSSLNAGYSLTSATKTVALPGGILKQGKAYSVNFTIYVDQIEVSATVDPWDAATNHPVNVPYYPDSI